MSSAQPKLSPDPASESSDKTLVDGAPLGAPTPGAVADESMALVGSAGTESGHSLVADVEPNGGGANGVIVDWSKTGPDADTDADSKDADSKGAQRAHAKRTASTNTENSAEAVKKGEAEAGALSDASPNQGPLDSDPKTATGNSPAKASDSQADEAGEAPDFEAAAAALGAGFDPKNAEAAAAAIRPSWAHVEYTAPPSDVPAVVELPEEDDTSLLAGSSSHKNLAIALSVFLIAALGIIYAVVGSGDSPTPASNASAAPPASAELPERTSAAESEEPVAEPAETEQATTQANAGAEEAAAALAEAQAAEAQAAEAQAAEALAEEQAAEARAAEEQAAETAAAEALAAEAAAEAAANEAAQERAAAEAQAAADAAAQAAAAAERAATAARNQRGAAEAAERRRAQRAARQAAAAQERRAARAQRSRTTPRMTTSMSNSGGFTTDNPY